MRSTIYFLSGVSGVGKSAVVPYLKSLLDSKFEVYDFDDLGVPDNADHQWRLEETKYWLHFGQQKFNEGKTIVVAGFFTPDEIVSMKKDFHSLEIVTILLDGEPGIIEQRLRNRNNNLKIRADLERVVGSAEDFIKNNTKFAPVLREIYQKYGYPIIDTSYLDPKAVAKKISKLIK